MADVTANNIDKAPVPNADTKTTESDSSLPSIAKAPLDTAEASTVPSTAPDTATTTAPSEPSSESAAQNGDTTVDAPKDEPAKKVDETGAQPENPSDEAPVQPPTDTSETGSAPVLSNGTATDQPKPVSVEEVRDQDLSSAKPSQPTEATGAVQSDKPADKAAKGDPSAVVTTGTEVKEVPEVSSAPTASEPEKAESTTGDKRKAEDAPSSNGESAADDAKEASPIDKKQKTNGAPTKAAARKPGRPRKEKKAPVPVGRTARKTRSQGAAE
ncbi:hypothetical protein F5X99DRAFT_374448 [Biscogniauxia marginata]|nr:hypothetical protein F5X99DRAFT_374448 [Biscogniauxia marginata]